MGKAVYRSVRARYHHPIKAGKGPRVIMSDYSGSTRSSLDRVRPRIDDAAA